jgi:hypothetical protein
MRGVTQSLRGLDLTDKQKDELKKLPEKLRADLLKDIKGILSKDQYKKFEEALKKPTPPPARRRAPPRPGAGGPRP